MVGVRDTYGRTFKTLRVSLTNTCNMGCVYCTFGTDEIKDNFALSQNKALTSNNLSELINQLHQILHLETIRFTGGEPLLYKELPELVRLVKAGGISDIKLTTNGLLLDAVAPRLKEAGLTSINVSLDAIDPDVFFTMSKRNGISRVFSGIDAALDAGLEVKINSVIMRGLNESQITPLLTYAFEKKLVIRFLEIMAMGHLYGSTQNRFFSQEEILEAIAEHHNFKRLPRKGSSTANYWQTAEGHSFGIVANETEPFCGDCNRLRLDSYGNIYGCLSSNNPISILDLNEEQLVNSLQDALEQKQAIKFTGSELSMMHIGG